MELERETSIRAKIMIFEYKETCGDLNSGGREIYYLYKKFWGDFAIWIWIFREIYRASGRKLNICIQGDIKFRVKIPQDCHFKSLCAPPIERNWPDICMAGDCECCASQPEILQPCFPFSCCGPQLRFFRFNKEWTICAYSSHVYHPCTRERLHSSEAEFLNEQFRWGFCA